MKQRLYEILFESDLSMACFMLGLGLIAWGLVAVFMAPADFFSFADGMRFGGVWFWFANYMIAGYGFVYVAMHRFPQGISMLVGVHAGLVWTWIAGIRGFSNITSGITLNAIVIVMGFLLCQRTGVKR